MFYLITLEWLKVKRLRSFRWVVAGYLILLPTLYMLTNKIPEQQFENPFFSTAQFYQFPTVWEFLGYLGSWLIFFLLGFLSVLLITQEYQHKTIRQNILNGLERKDIYVSKLLFLFLLGIGATLYMTAVGLAIGIVHTDITSFGIITNGTSIIYRYFIMTIGYLLMGYFFGILIQKTGRSIFLFFAYTTMVEPTLRWLLHHEIIAGKSMHYYPAKAFSDLIPLPIIRRIAEIPEIEGVSLFLSIEENIIISILYILLLSISGWFIFSKRDL